MILVDTSVWIDHLRKRDDLLSDLLAEGQVAVHPFVIGEIALGDLRKRPDVLSGLRDLPSAPLADDDEVLAFIEANQLFGKGVGYLDAHLLASARLSGIPIWTKNKRLKEAATGLGLAAAE